MGYERLTHSSPLSSLVKKEDSKSSLLKKQVKRIENPLSSFVKKKAFKTQRIFILIKPRKTKQRIASNF